MTLRLTVRWGLAVAALVGAVLGVWLVAFPPCFVRPCVLNIDGTPISLPRSELAQLRQRVDAAFIMVTHDSAIAKKAPRVATIRKGRITVKENAAT